MTKADTRVAVYPWTGLPALDRGSARRVVPLINLFAAHYLEVKILSPGIGNPVKNGNIEYQYPSRLRESFSGLLIGSMMEYFTIPRVRKSHRASGGNGGIT